MTEKIQVRFYAAIEEARDKKTSAYKLKYRQPVGTELYYEFSTKLQNVNNHPEIYALQKVKTVLSSIKIRGAYVYAFVAA